MPELNLRLLSDRPVDRDGQPDLLERADEARRLAELLYDSRQSAPFTLAVYADRGMGKSSLLNQAAELLEREPNVEVVKFNAWTAGQGDSLEILIKSVLDRLDDRSLRRLARAVVGDTTVSAWCHVLLRGVAGIVRAHHLVDGIWDQLEMDARTRNNAQELLRKSLAEFTAGPKAPPGGRSIVVFVDDLDRCPPETIRVVSSAIKQYLNLPGLVFVLACDRAIVESAVTGTGGGRQFLEKIIQAYFPIAAPTDAQITDLIRGYAHSAGAAELFKTDVVDAVARHADRNPRRIKQLMNRLVVEYRLDPEWTALGADSLIRAALLQDLYPDFYRLLTLDPEFDPLEDFDGYLALTELADGARGDGPVEDEDELWTRACEFLDRRNIPAPNEVTAEFVEKVAHHLPDGFATLVEDRTFVGLALALINSDTATKRLRSKLRRRRIEVAAAWQ